MYGQCLTGQWNWVMNNDQPFCPIIAFPFSRWVIIGQYSWSICWVNDLPDSITQSLYLYPIVW